MRLLAGHLDEALGAERAAARAQALTVVDRDLPPLAVGVAGGVVALARPTGLGLLLRPAPQVEHLAGHRPLRDLDERALLVGHALADAVQADVVGATLEHGVRRVDLVLVLAGGQRLDQPRDVALDELVLEREGRGGHDHAAVVEQRGDEVPQRLAGAGAGLHEQVLLAAEGVGDRLGHLHLSRPLLATEGLDGGGQHLPHAGVGVVRGHRATLCPTTDSRRSACTGHCWLRRDEVPSRNPRTGPRPLTGSRDRR